MLSGAAGMPLLLCAAAWTSLHLKYLRSLPVTAIAAGTWVGVWLAKQHARPLELWGWLVIALSMGAGQLMSTYAFDGPLPSPDFVGAYNDFPRRLIRLGHGYGIVLGVLGIFIARELDRAYNVGWAARFGVTLLVTGSTTTVALIALVAAGALPTSVLGWGPAMVAVATVFCIVPTRIRT
jgi:hypothetical protein